MRGGWMCCLWAACVLCHLPSHAATTALHCLTDCSPRIGVVSAFGAEADLLVAQTQQRKTHVINGNRFTTGILRGNRVVIVLSGVSMINSVMVTQLMLDHFRLDRLIMSGIAGALNPQLHVGDVTVPVQASPAAPFWPTPTTEYTCLKTCTPTPSTWKPPGWPMWLMPTRFRTSLSEV